MDPKRIIYLILSFISVLIPIIIGCKVESSPLGMIGASLLISLLFFSFYFLFHVVYILINSMINDDSPDMTEISLFFSGILTLGRKRIYYSDLGYFYIRQEFGNKNNIIISKQDYIVSKSLFETSFYGDINTLREEIKNKLEYLYKEELREKRDKVSLKSTLNNWDGYIDIKSKRDDKLKQLLK